MNFDDILDRHRGLPGEVTTSEGLVAQNISDATMKRVLADRNAKAEKLSFAMIKQVAEVCKDMGVASLELVYQILDSGQNFQGLRFKARGKSKHMLDLDSKCGDGFDLICTKRYGDLDVHVLRQWQGGFVVDVYTKQRQVAKSMHQTPQEWLTAIIDSAATKVAP